MLGLLEELVLQLEALLVGLDGLDGFGDLEGPFPRRNFEGWSRPMINIVAWPSKIRGTFLAPASSCR